MKKTNLLVTLLLSSILCINSQTIISQWNFNNITAGDIATATPSTGSGTISLIGGVTTPTSGSSGSGSSDQATPNLALQTTTYAASGTENKGRGIQINVATTNFSNISLVFDQRLSNTITNTWVVQYSTNQGASWTDATTLTFTPAATGTGDTWYLNRTVDLSSATEINNLPDLRLRIVAAFDPTTGDYLPATSGKVYATSGTSRFDMVTIYGEKTTTGIANEKDRMPVLVSSIVKSHLIFSGTTSGCVTNLSGQKVLGFEGSSIDVSQLSKGVYLVKLKNNTSFKFIKE